MDGGGLWRVGSRARDGFVAAVGVAVVFWDDGREETKKLREPAPLMALQLQIHAQGTQPAPHDTP